MKKEIESLPINLEEVHSGEELLEKAKWLEGKTLGEILETIKDMDILSRVKTKGEVGYVVEKGFFGIDKNSEAAPDISILGVEVKTSPIKFNKSRTLLSIKEPLSLNMIDYCEEYKNKSIKDSYLYKKNHKILFVFYIHDKSKNRSDYLIKYVFLWKIDNKVLSELEEDYQKILEKIKAGKAHEIHQSDHKYLTLCPKHNGNFKDPNEMTSKRKQPFNSEWAEKRAFRLKNRYMNLVISRYLGKKLEKGGWKV
jgi:DNA mismatch repair endonuclease MutH